MATQIQKEGRKTQGKIWVMGRGIVFLI